MQEYTPRFNPFLLIFVDQYRSDKKLLTMANSNHFHSDIPPTVFACRIMQVLQSHLTLPSDSNAKTDSIHTA